MCQIKSLVLSCSTSSWSMLNRDWSHHSHEIIKFVYFFSNCHEIHILTKERQLNCPEYGLQIWLNSNQNKKCFDTWYTADHRQVMLENSTWSNENCVYTSDIRLICTDFRSKHNLHKILHLVNLHSIYILSVHSLNAKRDSRQVMKYVHRVLTFVYIH